MSRYVIDAGVAVKWFIPEPDSDKARKLLDRYDQGSDELIAPDLLIPEAANVFWKRASRGDITAQDADDNLSDLLALNVTLTPSSLVVQNALTLARTHNRTVYDCLYLALSLDQSCDFITTDERLYNAIRLTFSQIKLLRDCAF